MTNRDIMKVLPKDIQTIMMEQSILWNEVEEIRLRVGQTLRIIERSKERLLSKNLVITKYHIKECLEYVSNYSIFAYEEEIRQGFITIEGGHRVGLVGKTFVEDGKVRHQKYINSINIRIAHQILGCGNEVMKFIRNGDQIHNTLIVSPPRCGKTTILRDIIRQLSKGNQEYKGLNVAVVDERSEIASCFEGKPSNDLGPRCDVLDACPKGEGIRILLRSMSPNVIAVDEIGERTDIMALEYSITAGCAILATMHGGSINDVKENKYLDNLLKNNGFTRIIVLARGEQQKRSVEVFDNKGNLLCL